jgi:hypothetical protein
MYSAKDFDEPEHFNERGEAIIAYDDGISDKRYKERCPDRGRNAGQ